MIQIQMVKVRILSLADTNKNDLIFFIFRKWRQL